MRENRDALRNVLHSYVEQFLDHLYEDVPDEEQDDELGSIVIAAEVYPGSEDRAIVPTYWSSNESPIWKRGFFELLADYHRLSNTLNRDDDD